MARLNRKNASKRSNKLAQALKSKALALSDKFKDLKSKIQSVEFVKKFARETGSTTSIDIDRSQFTAEDRGELASSLRDYSKFGAKAFYAATQDYWRGHAKDDFDQAIVEGMRDQLETLAAENQNVAQYIEDAGGLDAVRDSFDLLTAIDIVSAAVGEDLFNMSDSLEDLVDMERYMEIMTQVHSIIMVANARDASASGASLFI